MNTDPIAERAREELAVAKVILDRRADGVALKGPDRDMLTTRVSYVTICTAFAALTTESRPEGLERWRGIPETVEWITAEEGATVTFTGKNPDFNGLPNEAVTVCSSKTGWVDRTFRANTLADCLTDYCLATPHPQTNQQENLAGSQTDAPASGEVDAQLLQAIRDNGQGGQPVEVVLHSDGGWEVRTSDAAVAMREATPSEGARDSALEEAAKVAEDWPAVAGMKTLSAISAAIRALRTAKPEQAGAGS